MPTGLYVSQNRNSNRLEICFRVFERKKGEQTGNTQKQEKIYTAKKIKANAEMSIGVVAVPNYQKHLRCRRERERAIPKHQKHLKCRYLSISLCRPHLLPTAQDKNSERKSVERRWKFWPLQTHNLYPTH